MQRSLMQVSMDCKGGGNSIYINLCVQELAQQKPVAGCNRAIN